MRTDGFFTERAGGRVAAREVGEAVLLAARRSADERRVRHLGYLLAEVVVSPDVDTAVVHRALALVEPLRLESYHAWHATRADLLRRLDRTDEARAAYDRAIDLAGNDAEREFLRKRRDELSGQAR